MSVVQRSTVEGRVRMAHSGRTVETSSASAAAATCASVRADRAGQALLHAGPRRRSRRHPRSCRRRVPADRQIARGRNRATAELPPRSSRLHPPRLSLARNRLRLRPSSSTCAKHAVHKSSASMSLPNRSSTATITARKSTVAPTATSSLPTNGTANSMASSPTARSSTGFSPRTSKPAA